ncbi:hypothetical protein B0T26DRAFT_802746 [Lasiosphaeria miniovina]|uniref:Ankyrin repeat protein n=1 Tax=Lasiosphaeria miniovina TaxID=1954250 RepID=A0AA40DVA3_9PEZI|nr:uncharacterized protein B0T26DRAFT_802746 [Lasiosphaeria miniovina]KAK0717679.1 hypothetical protein B0T26DRAFT_802746 [Lasiosphaeria miniovina]
MKDEKRNAWQPHIDKIVDAAVSFKKLGDAAMKFDLSGYGALAWSVVSFGLEIAKNAKDAHSIILTSSDTIAQLRSRYTEYESLYRGEQSGWTGDRDVSAKKKEVERVDEEVAKYISHIVREKYAKRRVEEIVERIDAREQFEILEWISKMLYGLNHITVKEARAKDTCDWLLQREEFGEWSNGSSMILALQGSHALDECKPESRYRLVDTIDFLMANARHPLSVFISSRPDADIRDRFLSRPHITIQATDNQDDIEKFVNKEIAGHRRWNKMSPALREDILKTLLNQSSGKFQWANLQIKQLLGLQTEEGIRDRLGKLPPDLKEAYDEIYAKIAARNEHDRILANRAFMWVICAAYPLESSELLSTILLDPDRKSLVVSEEVDDDVLLDMCNNLLVLDPQRKFWQFLHLSVAEYFEEYHFSRLQADYYATKVCLVLLKSCDYQLLGSGSDSGSNSYSYSHSRSYSYSKPRKLQHPKHNIQIYARHRWLIHIKTQVSPEADSVLIQLLRSFLGSMNQYAIQVDMVKIFLKRGADANLEHKGIFSSPLAAAAADENAEIVELLLKSGADVNQVLQTGDYGSALAAAAARGNTEIVELLLKSGADVNQVLQTGDYGSALAAAVARGNIEAVELLLKSGADVNQVLQTGDDGSALAAAAAHRDIEIVKLLLKSGANINQVLDWR